MRPFTKPSGLDRLSLEARILYTGFSIFLLIAYATGAWLYTDDDLGISSSAAARYYLGETTTTPSPAETGDTGPELQLPDTPAPMRFAKSPRQVMETFHFHLFSVPVCLLIIGHLFMMSSLSTRTKAWTIAISSAATLVHLLVPPLIRFASPAFAPLMFPSATVMALGWIAMTAWPVVEMWRLPARSSPRDAPH